MALIKAAYDLVRGTSSIIVVLLVPAPIRVMPLVTCSIEVQVETPGGTMTVSPLSALAIAAATSDSAALAAFLTAASPRQATLKINPPRTTSLPWRERIPAETRSPGELLRQFNMTTCGANQCDRHILY